MTKQEACDIFGGTQVALSRALDMTRSGISQWADELTQEQTDRVLGAAIRLGLPIPATVVVKLAPTPQPADQSRSAVKQMG